jgi:transposase
MGTAATHEEQHTTTGSTLYMAMELSEAKWLLMFTVGAGQKAREKTIRGGDREALHREILRAKRRFGLTEDARVVSCYEAGREGFWLHRYLVSLGVQNMVVDSSSIAVNRRRRRAKTDRLDAKQLLIKLLRYDAGEHKEWSVVNVPSVADEAGRQPSRELLTLKAERTRSSNRIKGLLATQGIQLRQLAGFDKRLDALRLWDGSALAAELVAQLRREYERLEHVERQILAVERDRRQRLRQVKDTVSSQVQKLQRLRAIGPNSAWMFSTELFAWRQFRNRRQVGGIVGLTGTPYDSGQRPHEQGISKAGNPAVRAMTVEIAWVWLRYQPQSALSQWYQRRFGHGSSRLRRIGIVALARKLLIALWRYVEFDQLPEGAELKA